MKKISLYGIWNKKGNGFDCDGDKLHILSKSYAQYVNIYSPTEDFILSDNFFDMEAGERTVDILEGDPKTLCVRSVFDIK